MANDKDTKIQGEGDYEAARRYIEKTDRFAHSGQVDTAAATAKPSSRKEQRDLESAEEEGLAHSKAPGK